MPKTTDCGSITLKREDASAIRVLLSRLAAGIVPTDPDSTRGAEVLAGELERQLQGMESGSNAEREALYNRLTADDVGEGDLLSAQARAEIEGRIDEIDRAMECRSVARGEVEVWLAQANTWARKSRAEGEFAEANGHEAWAEIFEERLSKNTEQESKGRARVKVTWELSEASARESVMRAGGSPRDKSAVQGVIRRSRHAVMYPSGVTFGRTSELQAAGYRVVGIDIVGATEEKSNAEGGSND